jgi:crotonobetaine/carnitine-CoA ligase
VQDVAAYGIPSSEVESEDELMIRVVLKPQAVLTHEALCTFINENAPHYFVPRYLLFVDGLPYTPTNKVKKFVLRDAGVSEQAWDLKKSGYRVQR